MLPVGYHKIFIAFEQAYFSASKIADNRADFGINKKSY
jgi:hypothetical protein